MVDRLRRVVARTSEKVKAQLLMDLTKRKCKYIIPIGIVGISAKETRILRMRHSGFLCYRTGRNWFCLTNFLELSYYMVRMQ